jgi:hypothetical protein
MGGFQLTTAAAIAGHCATSSSRSLSVIPHTALISASAQSSAVAESLPWGICFAASSSVRTVSSPLIRRVDPPRIRLHFFTGTAYKTTSREARPVAAATPRRRRQASRWRAAEWWTVRGPAWRGSRGEWCRPHQGNFLQSRCRY